MPFQKGHKKVGGKKLGTKNKIPSSVAEAIYNTFIKVGAEEYLEGLAFDNPAVFAALLKAILPKNVNLGSQDDNQLTIRIRGYQGDGD